jgi:nucleoside-diphosphate kinase
MAGRVERTLVVLKPDAVQRRLVGAVLGRLEAKGLKIVAMRMMRVSEERARNLYAVHEGRDFYEPLIAFLTAAPVVALVAEGNRAVAVVRNLLGPTFGPEAPAGTIRGDFGLSRRFNLAHGSDSPESAKREIELLFEPHELLDYPLAEEAWLNPPGEV